MRGEMVVVTPSLFVEEKGVGEVESEFEGVVVVAAEVCGVGMPLALVNTGEGALANMGLAVVTGTSGLDPPNNVFFIKFA